MEQTGNMDVTVFIHHGITTSQTKREYHRKIVSLKVIRTITEIVAQIGGE